MSTKLKTVRAVFVQCQESVNCPPKMVKQLKKIYASMDYDVFWEEFIEHLKYSLIVFKRENAVEQTLNFVANFATSCQPDVDKENTEKSQDDEEEGVEEQEMGKFLRKLFDFLLQHHYAGDKAVRFRCCQLINKLLEQMADEAQIDDPLYDRIYECMQTRLRDKVPVVRAQAVHALARLQDPTDPDCPVIKAYVFLLGHDPIARVRKAVLSCIAASTQTLPSILERARDINPVVRKLAFRVLSDKVHIKALTIAQRVKLLEQGMHDRDENVRDACACRLLQAWLRMYEGNVLELLRCLDVENSLDVSKQAIRCMISKSTPEELVANFDLLGNNQTINPEQLTCENALYWKTLCEYLKSLSNEHLTELDQVLPNAFEFAKYLDRVMDCFHKETDMDKKMTNEFILQQLLGVTNVLDLSDEAGRKELQALITKWLINEAVTSELVKPLLNLYKKLFQNADQRINSLVETISDIREPIAIVEKKLTKEEQRQVDLKLAGVRVEINQLRDEMEVAVAGQDFCKAAETKERLEALDEQKQQLLEQSQPQSQEIKTIKNDPATLVKCLTIACEMLQDVKLKALSPTLLTLMESLGLPGFQNEEPAVRVVAVKALGMCCQISSKAARDHLLLFLQALQFDQEAVKTMALQVIFDLLHTFGLETFGAKEDVTMDNSVAHSSTENFESPFDEEDSATDNSLEKPSGSEEQTKTASSIISILSGLLDNECSELRTVAAEGFAKLLLSGRVISSRLLSRLILLWYNPVTEDDLHLRHCLGTFFPIFAFSGKTNQQVVEEAFLPIMNTLFKAPASSPLAEINVTNVSELLVWLTNSNHLLANQKATSTAQMEDTGTHMNVGVKVSNEILSNPNSFNVRTLSRILKMLDLTITETAGLKDLAALAVKMIEEVKDKQSLKNLEKYKQTICQELKSRGVVNSKPDETALPEEQSSQDALNSTVFEEAVRRQNRTLLGPQGDSLLGAPDSPAPNISTCAPANEDVEAPADTDKENIESQDTMSTAETERLSQAEQTPLTAKKDSAVKKKSKQQSSIRKARKQLEEEDISSDSDIENNAVSTITPVRRSTKKRKGSKRKNYNEDELCVKLTDVLPEDDDEKELVVALERIPLSDVENQVI